MNGARAVTLRTVSGEPQTTSRSKAPGANRTSSNRRSPPGQYTSEVWRVIGCAASTARIARANRAAGAVLAAGLFTTAAPLVAKARRRDRRGGGGAGGRGWGGAAGRVRGPPAGGGGGRAARRAGRRLGGR